MPVKTYSTDEKCPNCGVNIFQELTRHVYSEGGKDFEYECPSCGYGLEITVEPVPAFSISLVTAAPVIDPWGDDQGYDDMLFCTEHLCPKNLVDYDDGSRYECPVCEQERGEDLGLV